MPGGNVGAGLAPPATRAPNLGAASDAPTDHGAKVGAARAGIFEGDGPEFDVDDPVVATPDAGF